MEFLDSNSKLYLNCENEKKKFMRAEFRVNYDKNYICTYSQGYG